MRFPLTLLLSLFAAYCVSGILTVSLNPEISFWNKVNERRENAIATLRAKGSAQPIIFFTGGSSCAFSIDPEIIEKTCGTSGINLGLPVSSGARYILHQALRQANKGDTIVICLEPDLLTFPDQESSPTKLGFALDARRGKFTEAAGGSTFGKTLAISDYLTLSRPGTDYLITLLGRTASGKGYRYKQSDIGYHGLIRTETRDLDLVGMETSSSTSLHPEGRQLLESFAAAAKAKGIRLAYSMPWYFTATNHLTPSRINKRKLLAEINAIMPVIEDGYSGAMDGIENFADSGLHLSDKGTATRSQALAIALNEHLKTEN